MAAVNMAYCIRVTIIHKITYRFLGEFEGKLTAPKWKALAKCPLPTAQRDLKDLMDRGILVRNPGGSKNTSYNIAGW